MIIRLLLVFMTALVAGFDAMAEDFRNREGEVFAGPNVSLGISAELDEYSSAIHIKPQIGYALGAEARYNFSYLLLDIGLQAAFSKVVHNVEWSGNGYNKDHWQREYSNSVSLAAIGDRAFNKNKQPNQPYMIRKNQ